MNYVLSLFQFLLIMNFISLLWPPYGIGQTIIFSFCFFLLFSSPNLGGRRLGVYHTSARGVALVRI